MVFASAARVSAVILPALGFLVTAGCESTPDRAPAAERRVAPSPGGVESTAPESPAGTPGVLERYTTILDREFVVGPSAADQLGYRVDWNVQPLGPAGRGLTEVVAAGDSLFVLGARNTLARVRAESGERAWDVPVAGPADTVFGINRVGVGDEDLLLIPTEGNVWVVDVNTGILRAKHNVNQAVSTPGVVHGPFLILGTASGQLIWHHYQFGTAFQAYQLQGPLVDRPSLADGMVAAATRAGQVMTLTAASASQIWNQAALAGLAARPEVGPDAVYVAGLDQRVYAYDRLTGRVRWRHLTDAALRDKPVLLGEHLYQQVPGTGLVAFVPLPPDRPDGLVAWTAEGVGGNVVGIHDGELLVWDEAERVLSLVDARRGHLIRRVPLPDVVRLEVAGTENPVLYGVGASGEITRLVPRG